MQTTIEGQLVKWRDDKTKVNVWGRVTLPLDDCYITEIGVAGIAVAAKGGANIWIPYGAITFIQEA